MKTSNPHILKRIISFFLLCCFSNAASFTFSVKAKSASQGDGQVVSLGLRDRVVIMYDERGIPYIEAKNETDLYFAQGYATAGDRLFQMDLQRRTARGELSEILWSATLDEDKRHRLYGFAGLSETLVARAEPRVRAALENYARGVNAFIEY